MGLRRIAAAAACGAVMSGCADPASCGCADVSVSSASAWGGSEIVLVSTAFRGADSLPRVLMGQDSLAVRVIGPDSLAVLLGPTDTTGALRVVLQSGEELLTEPVHVHGLAAAETGPLFVGYPEVYPGSVDPTVIAYAGSRVVLADLVTGAVSPIGAVSDTGYEQCLVGPLLSASDPSLLVVAGGPLGCRVRAVRPTAPLALVDSGPLGGVFPAMQLDSARWLVHRKTVIDLVSGTGPPTQSDPCQGAGYAFVTGPAPDRLVVPIMCSNSAGSFVYDPRTGGHAYQLGFAKQILGAAFTASGDTLYVLEKDGGTGTTGHLWSVNARTGVALDSASLPDVIWRGALALDPSGRWLYAAISAWSPPATDYPLRLRVYDAHTLAPAAVLDVAGGVGASLVYLRLVPSSQHALYLSAGSYYPGAGKRLFRFTTPAY